MTGLKTVIKSVCQFLVVNDIRTGYNEAVSTQRRKAAADSLRRVQCDIFACVEQIKKRGEFYEENKIQKAFF